MAKHATTEMEFFQEFEFRPNKHAVQTTLECWKRDGGKYGEIAEWGTREFHVYTITDGYHHAGETTTFTAAFKLLRKKLDEESR